MNTILIIIITAIVYMAIGGFIAGLLDDRDSEIWYAFLWPVALLFLLIIAVVELPERFGRAARRWFNNMSNKRKD